MKSQYSAQIAIFIWAKNVLEDLTEIFGSVHEIESRWERRNIILQLSGDSFSFMYMPSVSKILR